MVVSDEGITSVSDISDTRENTVTGMKTTEENSNMETTDPAEQMNLTSFSINDISKAHTLFSA